jgi:hypothetical protein
VGAWRRCALATPTGWRTSGEIRTAAGAGVAIVTVPSSDRSARLLDAASSAAAGDEAQEDLEPDPYGRQKHRCVGCDIGTIYSADGVAWCLGCRYRVGPVPEAGAGRPGRLLANS